MTGLMLSRTACAQVELRIVRIASQSKDHVPQELFCGGIVFPRAAREILRQGLASFAAQRPDPLFKCVGMVPEWVVFWRSRREDHPLAIGTNLNEFRVLK